MQSEIPASNPPVRTVGNPIVAYSLNASCNEVGITINPVIAKAIPQLAQAGPLAFGSGGMISVSVGW